MYLKKTNNPVTSTEDPAISIDISSDEEDGGDKHDEEAQPLTGKTAIATGIKPSVSIIPTANGTKTSETSFNELNATRPGPASQKKRRLDILDETPESSKSTNGQQQLAPKPKKFKKEVFAKKSLVTFADVGGMDKALKELCELILHIKHPEMYRQIGLPPPRGFLLHGAPGTGKQTEGYETLTF